MTEFRTPVKIPPSPLQIDHHHRIFMVGSCFSEHIGQRLQQMRFPVMVNPYGITYSPISLAKTLRNDFDFSRETFFLQEDIWRHWDLHSSLAGPDLETTRHRALNIQTETGQFLQTADTILLTFGSAFTWFLDVDGYPVANCHKTPASRFTRKASNPGQMVELLYRQIEEMRQTNQTLRVILTVSPVRHWRDGAIDNQRSKARLLMACELLCNQLPDTVYFPAYEIVMDELRDYRFYAPDMLHPSEVAIEYIWERFSETFFNEKTRLLNQKIQKLNDGRRHRPFNPDTEAHRKFLDGLDQLEREIGI